MRYLLCIRSRTGIRYLTSTLSRQTVRYATERITVKYTNDHHRAQLAAYDLSGGSSNCLGSYTPTAIASRAACRIAPGTSRRAFPVLRLSVELYASFEDSHHSKQVFQGARLGGIESRQACFTAVLQGVQSECESWSCYRHAEMVSHKPRASEIHWDNRCPWEVTCWIDHLGLNNVVGDGVQTGRRYEGRATPCILGTEIV